MNFEQNVTIFGMTHYNSEDLIKTFCEEHKSAEDPHRKWRQSEDEGGVGWGGGSDRNRRGVREGGRRGLGGVEEGGASHANTDHDHHVGRI